MSDKCASKYMDLTKPFMVGEWLVEPSIERISNGDFEEKVEPRVMDLLVCLSSQAGEVITREELESKVWAGMVVGYDALSSAMIKLRKAFHEDAKHPHVIQTVSKRGYRLIAEVKPVNPVDSVVSGQSHFFANAIKNINNYRTRIGISTVLLVFLFGLGYSFISHNNPEPSNVEKPSIIVLPFVNMSGDPEQDYFSDGITEDIITDLSRISNMQVMARNTSFRYRGQVVTAGEIGKELNVQYVLQGSVRKANDQLRINSQLINTNNSYHVWAERFDRKLDEVFMVQDELTRKIVNALAIQLTDQEESSLARVSTNNFQAYEHFLLGQKLARERTGEGFRRATDEFKYAIKLDPSYARSYGALAIVIMRTVTNGWSDSPAEARDRALEMAKKAVSLNNTLPQTYWSLGFVHLYRNEYIEAAKAIEKSIHIAPAYADGYGLLALIHNRLGNAEQAIRFINKGIQLNPHYTWDYPYNLGRAYYYKGEYSKAIGQLLKALERNENAMQPRLFLTASYSGAAMQDDAEWEVEQILTINPSISISHITKTSRIENPKLMQAYVSHLRKAGMPE